jgi:hypothetical protein
MKHNTAYIANCLGNHEWTVEHDKTRIRAKRKDVELYIDFAIPGGELELRMWRVKRMNVNIVGVKRAAFMKDLGGWLKAIDVMAKGLAK